MPCLTPHAPCLRSTTTKSARRRRCACRAGATACWSCSVSPRASTSEVSGWAGELSWLGPTPLLQQRWTPYPIQASCTANVIHEHQLPALSTAQWRGHAHAHHVAQDLPGLSHHTSGARRTCGVASGARMLPLPMQLVQCCPVRTDQHAGARGCGQLPGKVLRNYSSRAHFGMHAPATSPGRRLGFALGNAAAVASLEAIKGRQGGVWGRAGQRAEGGAPAHSTGQLPWMDERCVPHNQPPRHSVASLPVVWCRVWISTTAGGAGGGGRGGT